MRVYIICLRTMAVREKSWHRQVEIVINVDAARVVGKRKY